VYKLAFINLETLRLEDQDPNFFTQLLYVSFILIYKSLLMKGLIFIVGWNRM
jgi:hypothetical protein